MLPGRSKLLCPLVADMCFIRLGGTRNHPKPFCLTLRTKAPRPAPSKPPLKPRPPSPKPSTQSQQAMNDCSPYTQGILQDHPISSLCPARWVTYIQFASPPRIFVSCDARPADPFGQLSWARTELEAARSWATFWAEVLGM